LEVLENFADDRGLLDETDYLYRASTSRTDQRVGLVDFLNQPCPGATRTSGEIILGFGGLDRIGWAAALGAGAANAGELAVVANELLAGVRDVTAKSGEEIESGVGRCGRRIRVCAAVNLSGVVGDLTGFRVIAQSIQYDGWMEDVPGQAFSRRMIVGRDAIPLKHGEAGMTPGQKNIDEPLWVILSFARRTLRSL